MSSPIPDAPVPETVPSPTTPDSVGFDMGFQPSLPALVLCLLFKIPIPFIGIKFKLPIPPIPGYKLPFLALAFNCSLKNPLQITKPDGGGRKSKVSKNPDDDYDKL